MIRLLLPQLGSENTVQVLSRGALSGLSSALQHFQRPLSGIGIKITFPPTQEHHSTFQVRIEPYLRDLKMFYLQNEAQFFDPVVDINQLQPRLQEAYEFLKQQAGPFLLSCRNGGPEQQAET